mgnify:CR=1 FL=1
MGWTFFWAFADKIFGIGYATETGKGWIDGGSPIFGFLNFASRGHLAETYKGLASSESIEWLFMLGLLGIGLPLLLGIGVRIAGSIGIAMYALMYTALITPENNSFLDDHIIRHHNHGRAHSRSSGLSNRSRETLGEDPTGQEIPITEVAADSQ